MQGGGEEDLAPPGVPHVFVGPDDVAEAARLASAREAGRVPDEDRAGTPGPHIPLGLTYM